LIILLVRPGAGECNLFSQTIVEQSVIEKFFAVILMVTT
jgi:hypothetical protein